MKHCHALNYWANALLARNLYVSSVLYGGVAGSDLILVPETGSSAHGSVVYFFGMLVLHCLLSAFSWVWWTGCPGENAVVFVLKYCDPTSSQSPRLERLPSRGKYWVLKHTRSLACIPAGLLGESWDIWSSLIWDIQRAMYLLDSCFFLGLILSPHNKLFWVIFCLSVGNHLGTRLACPTTWKGSCFIGFLSLPQLYTFFLSS